MSTLEKFGILVILILVVVIGVVAVWGVGGEEGANPFDQGRGDAVAVEPSEGPDAVGPSADLPPWPGSTGPSAAQTPPAPVPPPAIDTPVTPPGGALAVKPPVEPAPAPVPGTTYTVRKGDTLTKIAAATLGDGNKWQLIVDVNTGLDPRRLKIGQVLRIPGSGAVLANAPVPPPSNTLPSNSPRVNTFVNPDDGPSGTPGGVREVEVQKGDSYYKLAEKYLGDGSKWRSLMKLNNIDEKSLRPGMKVKLPAAE